MKKIKHYYIDTYTDAVVSRKNKHAAPERYYEIFTYPGCEIYDITYYICKSCHSRENLIDTVNFAYSEKMKRLYDKNSTLFNNALENKLKIQGYKLTNLGFIKSVCYPEIEFNKIISLK